MSQPGANPIPPRPPEFIPPGQDAPTSPAPQITEIPDEGGGATINPAEEPRIDTEPGTREHEIEIPE